MSVSRSEPSSHAVPRSASGPDSARTAGRYAGSYPRAGHYFRAQRRALRAMLVGTVVFPIALLATWASMSLRADLEQAELRSARLARVLQEHASKIFEANLQINSRIRDLSAGWDGDALRRHERELHERLGDIARGLPQAVSLSIADERGNLVANSRSFPAPPVSVADREDFRAIVDRRQALAVTAVGPGDLHEQPVFHVSMPRLDQRGEVAGMVSVTLRAAYFAEFYREVLGEEDGARAALLREDGAVLAAYPALGVSVAPAALRESLVQASEGPLDGVGRMPGLAGEDSVVARWAVSGGLHAVVDIPVAVILQQWRHRLYVGALLTFVPAVLLWAMIGLSLQRLRREEQSYLRWQEEMVRRQEVEERYRQARKLEAVGHLMTSVAHDFRNVLSVISFNTDLLITRPDASREKALAGIRKGVASGVALTGQLIGMARKREHRKEVLSLAQEVQGWSPLLRSTVGTRVQLQYDIAPDCWRVCADRSEFELAMINLAANARDAMPNGGVLHIGASNVSLDGTRPAGMRGNYVCVTVRDNGIGMPPEVVGHAFEPLFTTKPAGLGTGLGLAQVHDFCREVDGIAVIESEVARGTVVRLYLPAWQRADQMPRSASGSAVLLVADQARTVQGALESLQAHGHRVMLVRDEAEALAAAERYGFDLVVTDARLGATLGGLTLRNRLLHTYPFLTVLLMTDDADMMALAAVSGLPFLLKPWNAQTLVRHGILLPVAQAADGQSSASRL